MTIETTPAVLTDEQITSILNAENDAPGHRTMLDYTRAIEQAVLQSPEMQARRKDAAEHLRLLEGASAVLANCAEALERGRSDELAAHEARSLAQTILFALPADKEQP